MGWQWPKNFDCSGLIYYAYRQNGYKVPRALAYAGHSIGKKTATIKMGILFIIKTILLW